MTTAVTKLTTGLTTAATNPKNACVTRIESAPVSGAVMRNDMQDERDAPFLRISATTGTTEQLHSGKGTPTAALVQTDLRLSPLSHRRTTCREIRMWISPARNSPGISIGDRISKDAQRKSINRTAASNIAETASFPGSIAPRTLPLLDDRKGQEPSDDRTFPELDALAKQGFPHKPTPHCDWQNHIVALRLAHGAIACWRVSTQDYDGRLLT